MKTLTKCHQAPIEIRTIQDHPVTVYVFACPVCGRNYDIQIEDIDFGDDDGTEDADKGGE
jgi:hypothetical protein